MSGRVLAAPRTACPDLPESGAWPWREWNGPAEWVWLPRAEAEADERYLQVIPYVLLRNGRGDFWCYARAGGDERLRSRLSCGVGGHIDGDDAADGFAAMAEHALCRELREELGWNPGPNLPAPRAWLYEGLSAVGRVHIGLVYVLPWRDPAPPRPAEGEALVGLGFRPAEDIAADGRFELWSRLAAGFCCEHSS